MTIDNIKTPEDILEFMKSNIRYGWLDNDNNEHINTLKDFRRNYRTSSVEETISHGIGTCIEQVYLMHILLDKLNIPNKMFCTRVYEGKDFNELDSDEHMHCFQLYEKDGKVHQLEHPNWERVGIYTYKDEEAAIDSINKYYIEMAGGVVRPVTEFFEVNPGLSFKEFNLYINDLDNRNKNVK